MATIFTIGHSTRTQEEFLALLHRHGVECLVDIRAFPASRRMPHFARSAMEVWLPEAGVEYRWEPRMGGRRRPKLDSPHTALRSESFRAYADHMNSAEFRAAAADVLALAAEKKTAVMCAEKMWFQCHRMMVSDYYTAHGVEVLHIIDERPPQKHKLMHEARLSGDDLLYDVGQLF